MAVYLLERNGSSLKLAPRMQKSTIFSVFSKSNLFLCAPLSAPSRLLLEILRIITHATRVIIGLLLRRVLYFYFRRTAGVLNSSYHYNT